MTHLAGMTEHQDLSVPGLTIHYASTDRENVNSMIVLMPSALPANRTDRLRPHYARWSWHESWPESEVISIADPAMQQSPALNGAWFIHPRIDIPAAIAALVSRRASDAGIEPERVLFYGSSLGGFGAIACAAHLPGVKAVAEVPQIDFERWQPLATRMLEEHVLHGPIADLRSAHPERVNLTERLLFAGHIPQITLISNPGDKSYTDQVDFIRWCEGATLPKTESTSLATPTGVEGHRVLQKQDILEWLRP